MSLSCILKQTWQGGEPHISVVKKPFQLRAVVLAAGHSLLQIFLTCEGLAGTQMGLGAVLGPG